MRRCAASSAANYPRFLSVLCFQPALFLRRPCLQGFGHRPERLAELIARGTAVNLEAKRLRLVRHREGGPVSLVLLQFRKGGKPGLIWEEMCLFDPLGNPTDAWREVYHL